ncbi:BRCT domain-containing protein [Shewanella sp. 0m-11]
MKAFEICFTGFNAVERNELETQAELVGLSVKKNVTKNLHILCIGENAGPSKVDKAREGGSVIIDKSQFVHFADTGELPQATVEQILTLVESRTPIKAKQQKPNDVFLNKDAQPYGHCNQVANIEKAIASLHGILLGITADDKLKPAEHAFLNLWLKTHEDISIDPDIIDIVDVLNDVLEDGIIDEDEYDDLFCLINDVNDVRGFNEPGSHNQINQLLGLLQGISADNEINEREIDALVIWLNANQQILEQWPASVVASKLCEILEDGIITEDEKKDLLLTVQKITGNRFCETGDVTDNTTECFDDISEIPHDNIGFCFTGKFKSGSRKTVESKAQSLGAMTTKDVLLSTQFLVIGTLASRDWKYLSHGRKIEKAMSLKEKGHEIYVISEEQWLTAI